MTVKKKSADLYEYINVTYKFINKNDTHISYNEGTYVFLTLFYSIGSNMKEYTFCYLGEDDELVFSKKEIEVSGRKITVFELFPYDPYDLEENITPDFPQSIYFTAQNGILGYTYSDSVEYLIVNPIFK